MKKINTSFKEWCDEDDEMTLLEAHWAKKGYDLRQAEIDELKDAYREIDEYLAEIGELDHFIRWIEKRNKPRELI